MSLKDEGNRGSTSGAAERPADELSAEDLPAEDLPAPMNALFLIHSLRGGGTGRVCAALANALSARGHRVTVAVNFWERSVWHDAFAEGVELVELGAEHARSALGPLVRLIRERRPDSVLAFNYQLAIALLFARPLARLGGRRFGGAPRFRLVSRHIVALSESARIKGWWHRLMIKTVVTWLYRKVDLVVAQSDGMYRDLVENFRIPAGRAKVIYNPVLPAPVADGDGAPRPAAGIDAAAEAALPEILQPDRNDPPVILYLGRFKPQKQPFLLLDLLERLRERFPDLLLAAGGEGPLLEEFLAEVRSRDLEEAVYYLGYVRNTTPLFVRATATVLTSAYEGFPNVLIDSISHGTPVVSFDCPTGPEEIIEDGLNGYLVPRDDVDQMAQMVARLIVAPLSRDLVERTSARFSLERAVERYEGLLRG